MRPNNALSALLLLRLHAAGASQPGQPPQPYTTAYPAEMNLWDVPPPPDMKVNLRPFRLATRGTVTAVFFCLAWRATSLAERARDYQAPLGWLAKPFFVANVGAAMLAARHANRQKVLLKGVLHADVALEGLTLASSALRAGFPSSDQLRRPTSTCHRSAHSGGPRRALVLAARIELPRLGARVAATAFRGRLRRMVRTTIGGSTGSFRS